MELKELLNLLEEQINTKMKELNKLGKESKKLLSQSDQKQLQMAKIFKELEPVQSVIREQNPKLCGLFDSLVELDKDNKIKDANGNK